MTKNVLTNRHAIQTTSVRREPAGATVVNQRLPAAPKKHVRDSALHLPNGRLFLSIHDP
jgi:hypothetical protein